MWSLYSGCQPYLVRDGQYVANPHFPHFPNYPDGHPEYVALAKACLRQDPHERPTFAELSDRLLMFMEPTSGPEADTHPPDGAGGAGGGPPAGGRGGGRGGGPLAGGGPDEVVHAYAHPPGGNLLHVSSSGLATASSSSGLASSSLLGPPPLHSGPSLPGSSTLGPLPPPRAPPTPATHKPGLTLQEASTGSSVVVSCGHPGGSSISSIGIPAPHHVSSTKGSLATKSNVEAEAAACSTHCTSRKLLAVRYSQVGRVWVCRDSWQAAGHALLPGGEGVGL